MTVSCRKNAASGPLDENRLGLVVGSVESKGVIGGVTASDCLLLRDPPLYLEDLDRLDRYEVPLSLCSSSDPEEYDEKAPRLPLCPLLLLMALAILSHPNKPENRSRSYCLHRSWSLPRKKVAALGALNPGRPEGRMTIGARTASPEGTKGVDWPDCNSCSVSLGG